MDLRFLQRSVIVVKPYSGGFLPKWFHSRENGCDLIGFGGLGAFLAPGESVEWDKCLLGASE